MTSAKLATSPACSFWMISFFSLSSSFRLSIISLQAQQQGAHQQGQQQGMGEREDGAYLSSFLFCISLSDTSVILSDLCSSLSGSWNSKEGSGRTCR